MPGKMTRHGRKFWISCRELPRWEDAQQSVTPDVYFPIKGPTPLAKVPEATKEGKRCLGLGRGGKGGGEKFPLAESESWIMLPLFWGEQ